MRIIFFFKIFSFFFSFIKVKIIIFVFSIDVLLSIIIVCDEDVFEFDFSYGSFLDFKCNDGNKFKILVVVVWEDSFGNI